MEFKYDYFVLEDAIDKQNITEVYNIWKQSGVSEKGREKVESMIYANLHYLQKVDKSLEHEHIRDIKELKRKYDHVVARRLLFLAAETGDFSPLIEKAAEGEAFADALGFTSLDKSYPVRPEHLEENLTEFLYAYMGRDGDYIIPYFFRYFKPKYSGASRDKKRIDSEGVFSALLKTSLENIDFQEGKNVFKNLIRYIFHAEDELKFWYREQIWSLVNTYLQSKKEKTSLILDLIFEGLSTVSREVGSFARDIIRDIIYVISSFFTAIEEGKFTYDGNLAQKTAVFVKRVTNSLQRKSLLDDIEDDLINPVFFKELKSKLNKV